MGKKNTTEYKSKFDSVKKKKSMTRKNKTMSINPDGGILIIFRGRHRGKNNNKHVQTKALNILGTNLGKTTAGTKLVTGKTNQMKTRQGK